MKRGRCFCNKFRIDAARAVLCEMSLKVVGDLGKTLHPKIGLRVSTLPTALLSSRALKDRDLDASFRCSDRARKAGDAAARNDQVEGGASGLTVIHMSRSKTCKVIAPIVPA